VTAQQDIETMLGGGDRRSPGRAGEVAALALTDLRTRRELMRLLDSRDALLRLRAADALEKVSAVNPGILRALRRRLLAMASREHQVEVRWHLAQMLPRLDLSPEERATAVAAMVEYLEDESRIVRTWSMNALWEFARQDSRYLGLAEQVLAEALKSGSKAEMTRARIILDERTRGGRKRSG
jgi:hypothetical protein